MTTMNKLVDIAEGYESLLGSHKLDSLDAVFVRNSGEHLDKPGLESWRQRWRIRLKNHDQAERVLYLKRFEHPPLRRQLERWRLGHVRLSTAGVEWHNARRLKEAGIATVQPVACGQQMYGPWERRSFVLLAEVAGESLERWVPAHVPPINRETHHLRRRQLGDQLARFVARFHRAGFVHRDLYLSHIFICPQDVASASSDTANPQPFCLIDLQRMFHPRWRHRRWVVKDLAQLNYSTPADLVGRWERLRFICRYVHECDRFGSARRLTRLVAAKTLRMSRRRPLPPVVATERAEPRLATKD